MTDAALGFDGSSAQGTDTAKLRTVVAHQDVTGPFPTFAMLPTAAPQL
tara:strand:+ start:305 stop:448 length:144 start_codon:yes stop_codon:yes gene_type:complete